MDPYSKKHDPAELSVREFEILQLAADGLTDKEIARHLGISPDTVNSHWKRIRLKLGTASRTEDVATALRRRASDAMQAAFEENQRLQLEIANRRRADEALKASRETLRLATTQMPAFLWTTDCNLVLTSVYGSPAASKVDFTTLVGTSLASLPESSHARSMSIAHHKRALAGQSVAFEMAIGPSIFESRLEPLRDLEGQVVGCVGIALDVSRQRRLLKRITVQHTISRILLQAPDLEQALPNILKAICEMLDCSAGLVWRMGASGEALGVSQNWANEAGQEFVTTLDGASVEEGRGLAGLALGSERPVGIGNLEKKLAGPAEHAAVKHGLPYSFAHRLLDNEGQTLVVQFFAPDEFGDDEETFRSLTAIGAQLEQYVQRCGKQAAGSHDVEQPDRSFLNLAEVIPQIVFSANTERKVDFLNKQWRRVTGVAPEDALGAAWEMLVHPADRRKLKAAWSGSSPDGRIELDLRLRTAEGEFRPFLLRLVPVDANGGPRRWIGVLSERG